MSYLVVVSFDLDNAVSGDYQCIRDKFDNLDLYDNIVGESGDRSDLPTTTFAGNSKVPVQVQFETTSVTKWKGRLEGAESKGIFLFQSGESGPGESDILEQRRPLFEIIPHQAAYIWNSPCTRGIGSKTASFLALMNQVSTGFATGLYAGQETPANTGLRMVLSTAQKKLVSFGLRMVISSGQVKTRLGWNDCCLTSCCS